VESAYLICIVNYIVKFSMITEKYQQNRFFWNDRMGSENADFD